MIGRDEPAGAECRCVPCLLPYTTFVEPVVDGRPWPARFFQVWAPTVGEVLVMPRLMYELTKREITAAMAAPDPED